MLLATHARGEYLIYSLLINDAGLLSEIQKREDLFKEFDETHYGKYKKQISIIAEYNEVLDEILDVDREVNRIPEIIQAIQDTSQFTWEWFWDSVHVDANNVIMRDYYGELWPYECVIYDNINSIQKMQALTRTYYTQDITNTLMSYKEWIEYNGSLYVSKPDGLGGPAITKCEVEVSEISENLFELNLYYYYNDSDIPDGVKQNIRCEYINGNWAFDQILIGYENVPIEIVNQNEVYQYVTVLNSAVQEYAVSKEALTWEYAVADLNNDDVKELLILKGTCQGDARWHVYQIQNDTCVLVGSFDGWHSILYECTDGGIYNRQESSLSGTIYKIKIESNQLKEEFLYEYDDGSYDKHGTIGDGVRTSDITDKSLLNTV